MAIQHQLIPDDHGEPTSIVIPIATWRNMVDSFPQLAKGKEDENVPQHIKEMLDARMLELSGHPERFRPLGDAIEKWKKK